MLCVDGDRAASVELVQIDAMPAAGEAQLNPMVYQSLPAHAVADSGRVQQVHRALLEHSGADSLLDVLAALGLDDHRIDAFEVEQVRKQQVTPPVRRRRCTPPACGMVLGRTSVTLTESGTRRVPRNPGRRAHLPQRTRAG